MDMVHYDKPMQIQGASRADLDAAIADMLAASETLTMGILESVEGLTGAVGDFGNKVDNVTGEVQSVGADVKVLMASLATTQAENTVAAVKRAEAVSMLAKVEDVKEEVEGSALQTENVELGEPLDKFESAITAAKIKGAPAHPLREDIDDGDVAQTLAGLAKVVPTSQWASIQIKDGCVVGVTLVR